MEFNYFTLLAAVTQILIIVVFVIVARRLWGTFMRKK